MVDILQSYWRSLNPYRGVCTVNGGGPNSTLFSTEEEADVPITSVMVDFTTVTILNTIGVLLGGAVEVTTSLTVETSSDGITWTSSQLLPSTTFVPGDWSYFDLDPSTQSQYVRLGYTGEDREQWGAMLGWLGRVARAFPATPAPATGQ